MENLDLNTVEKWLRSNHKQVCKCRKRDSTPSVLATHLIHKSANNVSLSPPNNAATTTADDPMSTSVAAMSATASYRMISMSNMRSTRSLAQVADEPSSSKFTVATSPVVFSLTRPQRPPMLDPGSRKFSLNSMLDDIKVNNDKMFDTTTRSADHSSPISRPLSLIAGTGRRRNCNNCIIHKRKLHNSNFDRRPSEEDALANKIDAAMSSQCMNNTVIPIIVNPAVNESDAEASAATTVSTVAPPPNTSLNLLKCLIKSKIKFQSSVRQTRRELSKLNRKEINLTTDTKHLLEFIKDISRELHLKQLVERVVCNMRLLMSAEHVNVYFVCQNKKRLAWFRLKRGRSSSTFCLAPGKSLSGATIFEDNNTLNDFDNEMPFGSSLLGKVALTGNLINVPDVTQVRTYIR
jgi:hypothetical protein